MWEKLNKIKAQVIVCMIVVIGCMGFLYLLAIKEVPKGNEKLLDILGGLIIGSVLTGSIGWLFTQSKHDPPKQ